ncbi:MAG: YdcF family protein [Clostridia bacterium]|nr:YdcF family protein [Clostridia bacterium]
MNRDSLKTILTGAAVALGVVIFSAIFVFAFKYSKPPAVMLADVVLLLLSAVGVMLGLLKKNMSKTVYAYTNIALIGSIIFCTVFALVFTGYFMHFLRAPTASYRQVFESLLKFPRHFSYYAVFVIMAICLFVGVSNVELMRREGFRPKNALSIVVALFYIIGTVLVYLISDSLNKHVFIPLGISEKPVFIAVSTVIPLFLLLMLCYFECVFLGSVIMGWIAARKKPAYDKDYIIILGCSINKKGGLLPLLKGRVNSAIRFAWEQEIATGKPAKYVPSGGQGPDEIMSEGSAMELYLKTRGAEDYEVFPERESTTTLENFRFSKRIIDELNPNAKIAFATTNYHILRSGIIAREAGFDAEGIAGDTKWYFWPNGFVREFFGILKLKMKAHITVAAITAAICLAIGIAAVFIL